MVDTGFDTLWKSGEMSKDRANKLRSENTKEYKYLLETYEETCEEIQMLRMERCL